MAAPSSGDPVIVTVGAVWRLQAPPPQRRPQRLAVAATLERAVIISLRVIFGVLYFKDCPQHPFIPNYLLGLALLDLLMIPFVTFPCESEAAQQQEYYPRRAKDCLLGFIGLFTWIWTLAGFILVISAYQPNYDPTAADGLYCNKTLYTFAFWNAVFVTCLICGLLAKICKGLCWVKIISPVPANRDFYNQV